jgi:hypothetical protein
MKGESPVEHRGAAGGHGVYGAWLTLLLTADHAHSGPLKELPLMLEVLDLPYEFTV